MLSKGALGLKTVFNQTWMFSGRTAHLWIQPPVSLSGACGEASPCRRSEPIDTLPTTLPAAKNDFNLERAPMVQA